MALSNAEVAALQAAAQNPSKYGDGTNSTSGEQFNTSSWIKNSLIELAPRQWFSQVASTISAPKHMGTKLQRYLFLPLLDDRNVNDQGIDATGAVILNGNLYGSSRDVTTITKFTPNITEFGGRVNRVYFKRIKIEGTFEEFGFFYEYTENELQFDTDAELKQHNYREALRGATKIHEDRLQIDLLNAAGTVLYGGAATTRATLTGDAAGPISVADYDSLVDLSLRLDDLDTPTNTKLVKGSTLTDTLTINEARPMFVGTQVVRDLMRLKDYHNKEAFVELKHYAAAGNTAHGEIGAIASFRIIKVGKDMVEYSGQGAIVNPATNAGYRSSINAAGENRYDVFPMLVVGDESYTTISFKNTYGGSNKFEIFTQDPKPKIRSRTDPYGKVGFAVITWWYGFMVLRGERIARYEVVGGR